MLLGPSGELWMFDPGDVEHAPTLDVQLPLNLTFARGALLQPVLTPGTSSSSECLRAANHLHSLSLQRAHLSSHALAAALVAANASSKLRNAFCSYSHCEFGCAVLGLPTSSRAALLRLGELGVQLMSAIDSLHDSMDGLTLGPLASQHSRLRPGTSTCEHCAVGQPR